MEDQLQCPACRKRHTLPLAKATCLRCELDFSGLVDVLEAAKRLRHRALSQLHAGAYEEALASSTESWNLKNDPATARQALVICLAQGDFESAEDWQSSLGNVG